MLLSNWMPSHRLDRVRDGVGSSDTIGKEAICERFSSAVTIDATWSALRRPPTGSGTRFSTVRFSRERSRVSSLSVLSTGLMEKPRKLGIGGASSATYPLSK